MKMSGCLFLVVVVQYKDSGFTLGPHFFLIPGMPLYIMAVYYGCGKYTVLKLLYLKFMLRLLAPNTGGAQVRSLVRELRSHMLWGVAKKVNELIK